MAETPKAFVCGHPIKHSRSPIIHNYWLRKYGISGAYERVDIAPENLTDFLVSFQEQGFVGGNFTIPHKEQVFAQVAQKDEAALAIGAANTVWYEGGELSASNTDAYGFAANLDDQLPRWRSSMWP